MTTTLSTEAALCPPPIYRRGNSDILPAWHERDAATAEPPWTAGRCHRLLRPLLTHLAALQRARTRAALKERDANATHICSGAGTDSSKRPHAAVDLASRKRVRYTYSQKGMGRRLRPGRPAANDSRPQPELATEEAKTMPARLPRPERRSCCPGEVVVATPMLSRARKQRQTSSLPSSPILQRESEDATALGQRLKYRGYYHRTPRLDRSISSSYNGGGNNSGGKSPFDQERAMLAKTTSPELRQLYEAIFRAVDSLIRATTVTATTTAKTTKCKSLLAMCLRKVPQYVAACEATEREEAEEQGAVPSPSISMDVYSDLESSMGSGAAGWKPLRSVVRQHGICILTTACAEGLLSGTFLRLLVMLCRHRKAYNEAESLMAALFDRHIACVPAGQHLYRKPDDADSDLADTTGPEASLRMLLHYADESGRTSYPLRQMTSLLRSGHLPAAWLSTNVTASLWHRIIRLLSSRGAPACDDQSLLDFVAVALARLVLSRAADDLHDHDRSEPLRRDSKADPAALFSQSSSYHTLVSIVGSVCAVGILQQDTASEDGEKEATTAAILRRMRAVLHEVLSGTARETVHSVPRRFLLMLAGSLVGGGAASAGADTDLVDTMLSRRLAAKRDASQRRHLYDVAVTFVASVAESCGRGADAAAAQGDVPAARGYLLRLCSLLAGRVCCLVDGDVEVGAHVDAMGTLVRRLQADAAFVLASRSNDLRDLAFAESLSKDAHEHQQSPRRDDVLGSPATGASAPPPPPLPPPQQHPTTALFAGYRWEEGISEWVICSPRRPVRKPDEGRVLRRRQATAARLSLPMPLPSTPPPLALPDRGNEESSDNSNSSDEGDWTEGVEHYTAAASAPPTPSHKTHTTPIRNTTSGTAAGTVKQDKTTAFSSPPFSPPSSSPPSSDAEWRPAARPRPKPRCSWPRASMGVLRTRTRQSLLSLVSDDESDSEETTPNAGGSRSRAMSSRGLVARAEKRAPGPGERPQGQKRRLSICLQARTGRAGSLGAHDNVTSDDELCL